jgi:hypothetical protein
MDINCLSQEEQLDHIKKGLCFVCYKAGHLSFMHKEGRSPLTQQTFSCDNQKGKSAYQKIHAITDKLGKEEKDEIADLMGKEGF